MPESISSQSSTPTPYNGTNGPCETVDNQWNQVEPISPEVVQNGTPLGWTEMQSQQLISAPAPMSMNNIASSLHHNPTTVNNFSSVNQQIHYNPPSYMNIPYQRNVLPNGYTAVNVPRSVHGQAITGPTFTRTQNGQLIGGSNWSNQPNLGRFIAQGPTWTGNKSSGGVKKQKRIRTAFTSQQMMELEQEYARTRYLDRARRIELADGLRLNERTIKIWFQNRRMKEKKDRAESLEDSEEASTSESSPEMSNIPMPILIHEQYAGIPNEVYGQGNVYMEQMPPSSGPNPMFINSLPETVSQVPVPVQNMYSIPEYVSEEQYGQYQQVHLQVQQYPTTYESEVQDTPHKPESHSEAVSSTSAPSDIIEKSWDLSWIKSIKLEEEY